MNVPEKLEVPVFIKDTDGNDYEVDCLVYKLERNGKSRWAELFGTPERAAQTIANISGRVNLDRVGGDYDALLGFDGIGGEFDALLEWLKGDV